MTANNADPSLPGYAYHDLLAIVKQLRADKTRNQIMESWSANSGHASKRSMENSVNLAARLLTMLKIGRAENQVAARSCLDWSAGTLREFTAATLSTAPVLECAHIRLPKAFDAWSLNSVAGLSIEFTDNLADHLLLVNDDTKVLVFHHVAFLECQKTDDLFPAGLIDETLCTLALLFPQAHFGSTHGRHGYKTQWLKKLILGSIPQDIDLGLAHCGTLHAEQRQVERFHFWRDWLVILKQTYDETTPMTISQWWHDKRSGERWCTFWVAILVLLVTTLLGFVQCVEGALQVYKAYNPS